MIDTLALALLIVGVLLLLFILVFGFYTLVTDRKVAPEPMDQDPPYSIYVRSGLVDGRLFARVWVHKNHGTGYWSNNPNPWTITVNNKERASGTWTYDFRFRETFDLWEGVLPSDAVHISAETDMGAPGKISVDHWINLDLDESLR